MGRTKKRDSERIMGAPQALTSDPAPPSEAARSRGMVERRKVLFDPQTLRKTNEMVALFSEKWGSMDWPKATRALWRLFRMDGRRLLEQPTPEGLLRAPSRTQRVAVLEHENALLSWLHRVLEIPPAPSEDLWVPPNQGRAKGKNFGFNAEEIVYEARLCELVSLRWGKVDKSYVTRALWRIALSARRRVEYMPVDARHGQRAIPFGTKVEEIDAYIQSFAEWLYSVLHVRRRQPLSEMRRRGLRRASTS